MTKLIVITGGVLSGLGKGTATAAIGRLLSRNFKCIPIKCDGYINVDPGTMNPFEHGEVFVLDDGGEVDMDFGHYERFFSSPCTHQQNLTTGKIFDSVIKRERKGDFLGGTVQVIPHITNEIKSEIRRIGKASKADCLLIEIGGTIGDIENSWFIEAIRQMRKEVGRDNFLSIHLTYVPFLSSTGEQKTKPAQRDVETLRGIGIIPDIIIARSDHKLSAKAKKKIALFCDVDENAVISSPNIETIYEVPSVFEKEGMLDIIGERFKFKPKKSEHEWNGLLNKIKHPSKLVNVAICGKYTDLSDSYASLIEAIRHAAAHFSAKVNIKFIETTTFETKKSTPAQTLSGMDAIIVPIGFGSRGAEGKIQAINFARTRNIPFLGLCFGLQLAVVEFARSKCGLKNANSTEINPKTPHPVVDILPEQKKIKEKGATMRLGSYRANLKKNTKVQKLYGSNTADERHRHRYEVNPKYHKVLLDNGLVISGSSRNGRIAEFIELPDHKYFVATQSHPEYKSKLEKPSPLFYGLIKAALQQ